MDLDELVNAIPRNCLSSRQMTNVKKILSVSESFHRDAGTFYFVEGAFKASIHENTIVLESSCRPEFLHSMDVWRRVFLLDILRKKFIERGFDVIALFGFDDCCASDDPRLGLTRIPAYDPVGFLDVGFPIPESDLDKSFCLVDKPSSNGWVFELERIRNFYMENVSLADIDVGLFERNFFGVSKILGSCFEHASNFSDINSFLF